MRNLFLWLAIFVANSGTAGEIWHDWKADGTGCSDETADVLVFGEHLALILGDFTINLETGAQTSPSRKDCRFRVNVTPPAGTYLAGFRQVYSGGILKGARSQVTFHINYKLGNMSNQRNRHWKFGKAITPEDPESVFAEVYEDVPKKPQCKEKTQFHLNMHLSVTRQAKQDAVIVGLDTVDMEVSPSLRLVPIFKPCRR